MSILKKLSFKLRVSLLRKQLRQVHPATPYRAALLIVERKELFSCLALEGAISRHFDETAEDYYLTKDAYRLFTCMFGRPFWWNRYSYIVEERVEALYEFGRAVAEARRERDA